MLRLEFLPLQLEESQVAFKMSGKQWQQPDLDPNNMLVEEEVVKAQKTQQDTFEFNE